ncbi:MAG: SBBP repeat-containing protein, partial [Deltaproteobacteria bacterium]|nr:SBBP repeat-containing protein [Deltaproteobacteria bacterium]
CGSKCVDLQTDPANCGGCGLVCGCSLPCSLGKCSLSCQGGTTKCGCKCVDTQTDPTNCGGCGKPCAPGEVCSAGACAFACLGGATKCGSKCVDLQLDPANCGGCGKACAQGEVCSGGACGLACAGGTTKCGSKCVDVANDPASCGGCGKACAQGEVCVQGACKIACGQGLTNCGGKCADMQGDAANCGGCGKVCAGICTAGACVGTGKHLWSKRFGDASNQMGYGIAADGAGNAFVTGDLQGTADFGGGPLASAGGADIFVAKLDPAGSHLWGKRFGDGSEQHGRDIAVDGAGNVLVTGYFQGSIDFGGGLLTAGGWNVFVAKLDPTGAHLWSKRCTGGDELGWSVAADGAGNVLIAGEFVMTMDCGGGPLVGAGGRDIFVAKLDSTGKHVWSKRFGDSAYQHALSIATDGSDNVLVTGFFEGNIDFGGGLLTSAGADDVFVAKLDKDGKHLWSKRFGDGSGQSADGVVADASGNVLLAGSFGGSVDFGGGPLTSAGKSDIFVAKLDPSGTHLWSKRFGNAGDQYAKSIAVDGQGNAVVTGYFDGAVDFGGGVLPSAGTYDILAAKFAPAGGHLWSKRFGDGSNQLGYDIAADGLGNVLMTGEFQGTVDFGAGPLTSAGLRDIFVAKLGP